MTENLKKINKNIDKINPYVYNKGKEAIKMSVAITSTAAIKELMQKQGVTNADMSKRVGITPQTMYERLAKDNMKVNTLYELATTLGYKIVLVPNSKKVSSGEYEIK